MDKTPPKLFVCPSYVSANIELGTTEIPVHWITPTASDESGKVTLVELTHSPGENFAIGQTWVSYTFVDEANNTATCSFMVTVTEGERHPKVQK